MSRTSAGPSLDPDVVAQLESERDFLLRSLDDLDAEHGAGDLDENDYRGLGDDYTRRLAEVSRALADERNAFARVDNKLNGRQRFLTVAAVALVAILAGVFLARSAGFRSPEDSVSGDIRRSSAGLLAEADTLTREGQWPEAIDVYNQVLDVSPANAEAWTYRGWLTARLGDNQTGLADLAEAVAIDPNFPDARVFSAILLDDDQRFGEAAEHLAALDTLETPEEMLGLIGASNLRASVTAGQIRQRYDPIEPGDMIDLSLITATLDDAARAGALFTTLGDTLLARATFEAVLGRDPEQIIALVGRGQLARDQSVLETAPELAAAALADLDLAVELAADMKRDVVLLYRADARRVRQDVDGARADLARVDADQLTGDLRQLFDNLTAALDSAG